MKDTINIRRRLLDDLSRDPGILILAYPYARTWRDLSHVVVQERWGQVKQGEDAAVYVHIPFCRRKCKFCDFLAYYGRPETEIERYMALLQQEIQLVTKLAGQVNVRTVHLGGGTPSLLLSNQVAALIDNITSHLCLYSDAQITMEVFPDSFVTKEQLIEWRKAGVNRLSFGFQFFDDALKATLNRTDLASDNLRLFNDAIEVGYDDINVDLMCGLPEQSAESWSTTLFETVKLNPSHICVFPVSVRHQGIPLFKNQASLPPPDKTRLMYQEAVQLLCAAGYKRTTRHNFVRPNFEYRYERMIAELSPLIGLGANSISYSKNCIYRNHSDLAEYSSAISSGNHPLRAGHIFDESDSLHNYAVRRVEYLELYNTDFEGRFGLSLSSVFGTEIALLDELNLAHLVDNNLILTEEGVYYTSAIKRTFFHQSAWDRLNEMKPDEFRIERSTFAITQDFTTKSALGRV